MLVPRRRFHHLHLTMTDYKIPELPSDEELGIAGLSEEDLAGEPAEAPAGAGDDAPPPPPPAPGGSGKGRAGGRQALPWRGWVTLAVLLVGTWFSSSFRSLPSTRAATAPDTAFASGRALVLLSEIARAPRPPGSPEHERVRGVLIDRLTDLGLDPQVQEVTQISSRRDRAHGATVRNILARIPGTNSTGALLLTAHYDGVPGSPGAGDDATGVAAIIETLRAILSGPPLRNDLIILITDGEELGLLGARAFVERHPWIGDVQVVLSVEMRGAGGPSIMFETGPENGWIIRRLRAADPHPMANSISTEIYKRLPNDTDFSPFRDAGIQGMNFAAVARADRYHQSTDTPEHLQEATLQHHGSRVLAMTRDLGDADLSEPYARDRAFVVLPLVGMVDLSAGLVIPVSLGLLLALLVVTFLASLRGTRTRGFLMSGILSGLAIGLSAGAGWALLRWFVPLLPGGGAGAMVPAAQGEGILFAALAVLSLAITTALFSLGHRWMSPLEATLGALLLPVLGLLGLTFIAPGAAVNLQGPMAATLLLLALLTGVGLHRARGTVAWIASLALALPVLAFLVPVLELVSLSLTFRAAPVMGGLMAFGLLFLLPALSALDYPNRWWAPLTALTSAVLLLGVAWLRAGPSADRPLPSTLIYTAERTTGGALQAARWASLDGPGFQWAQDAIGTSFTDSVPFSPEPLSLPRESYRTAEAPLAAVPAPEAALLSDTLISGRRRVRLGLRSAVGAEMIRVALPPGVEFVGVNGAAVGGLETQPFSPAVRSLVHWGRPASRLEVELEGPAGEPWELELLEHHLRPEELLGEDRFQRPPELRPNLFAGSDRAVFLSRLRIPVPRDPESTPGAAAPSGDESGDSPGSPSPAGR